MKPKQTLEEKEFLAGKPTREEIIKFIDAKIVVLTQSFDGYLKMRETALYEMLIEKGIITEQDVVSLETGLNEKLNSMKAEEPAK